MSVNRPLPGTSAVGRRLVGREGGGSAVRAGLAYLVVVLVYTGVWALLSPHTFHAQYPGFGLRFLSPLGPFDEHLVNDFGTLYVGFAVLFGAALVRPEPLLVRVSLISFLVYAVPHFAWHVGHLDPLEPTDATALVLVVGSFVVVPALVLLVSLRRR